MEWYEKTLEILSGKRLVEYLGRRFEYVERIIKGIAQDLKEISANDKYKPQTCENDIITTIEYLKEILLFDALGDDAKSDIIHLLNLIYNWNMAFSKSPVIERETMLSIRLAQSMLTITELIAASRELLGEIKRYRTFVPPSFDLSKHYLQMLLEKNE